MGNSQFRKDREYIEQMKRKWNNEKKHEKKEAKRLVKRKYELTHMFNCMSVAVLHDRSVSYSLLFELPKYYRPDYDLIFYDVLREVRRKRPLPDHFRESSKVDRAFIEQIEVREMLNGRLAIVCPFCHTPIDVTDVEYISSDDS